MGALKREYCGHWRISDASPVHSFQFIVLHEMMKVSNERDERSMLPHIKEPAENAHTEGIDALVVRCQSPCFSSLYCMRK